MLTDFEYSDLAADGLILREDAIMDTSNYPVVQTISDNGILCLWAGQGDVFVVAGQMPMDQPMWQTTRAQLFASGFTPDDVASPGFLNGPDAEGESYVGRGVAYANGTLIYVSYPALLPFVKAYLA